MDLIDKYQNFIETIDFNPFDFIPGRSEIFFEFINETEKEDLLVIGKNKAGCLICLYNQQVNKRNAPIVWLDSERSPSGIFAENIEMFFSLLPYGTGYIHNIMSHIIDINNNYIATANCEKFESDHQQILRKSPVIKILSIYEKIMGVSIFVNPCEFIHNSISNHWNITDGLIKK